MPSDLGNYHRAFWVSQYFQKSCFPTMAYCIFCDMSQFTTPPPLPPHPHPLSGAQIRSIPAAPVTQRLGGTGLWGGAGGGGVAQREGSSPHGAARVCAGEGLGVDAVAMGPLPETQQIGRAHQRNPETQHIGRTHPRGPPNLAADFFLAGVVWQRVWTHRKAGRQAALLCTKPISP